MITRTLDANSLLFEQLVLRAGGNHVLALYLGRGRTDKPGDYSTHHYSGQSSFWSPTIQPACITTVITSVILV